jgi:hypothetical protein
MGHDAARSCVCRYVDGARGVLAGSGVLGASNGTLSQLQGAFAGESAVVVGFSNNGAAASLSSTACSGKTVSATSCAQGFTACAGGSSYAAFITKNWASCGAVGYSSVPNAAFCC